MKYGLIVGILLALLMIVSGVNAQFYNSADVGFSGSTNSFQNYQPTFNRLYSSNGDFVNSAQMWPVLGRMESDQCNATSDFIIGIPPGGCTPSVVRSDLLEEQNVPVFCQLYAIKVNPLIKVSSIRSIKFDEKVDGVKDVVFHPARAAVKSYTTLLGDPTLNNIGYVVIILERNKIEANMEEWIAGNLSATIRYDAEEAYGTGASEYYLPQMSDEDWDTDYAASSFWSGRGFLRMESSGEGSAKIQILSSKDRVVKTFNLKEGETSPITYLPGYYCRAGLRLKLDEITVPEDKVLLNLNGEEYWLREGDRFYNEKCKISNLDIRANNDGDVTIKCNGNDKVDLGLKSSGALFEISGKSAEYVLGDSVYEGSLTGINTKGESTAVSSKWYLAYAGKIPKNYDENQSEITILLSGAKGLTAADSAAVYNAVNELSQKEVVIRADFLKDLQKLVKVSGDSRSAILFEEGTGSGSVSFTRLVNRLENKDLESLLAGEYFEKSTATAEELVETYRNAAKENGETYGEEALYEQIILAETTGQRVTQAALMDLFVEKYPSAKIIEDIRYKRRRLDGTDFSNSLVSLYVNDRFRTISVVDFRSEGEGERSVDLRVGGSTFNDLKEGWTKDKIGGTGNLTIEDIHPGKIRVSFNSGVEGKSVESRDIAVDGEEIFNGVIVAVRDIEVEEVAHVSIIPEVKRTKTEAEFTFRIGIEKRAIELSPERTRRMLKNLEEAIEKWENIVERLGNVVKGLKGACFATSTFLMIKNAATGYSGEAAARQRVMEDFKSRCDTEFGHMSRTECYNHLSNEIDGNVSAMSAALNSVNGKMDTAMVGNTGNSEGLFGGTSVTNQTAYKDNLRSQVVGRTNDKGIKVVDVNISGNIVQEVPVSKLDSVSQIQAVLLNEELKGRGVIGDGKSQLDENLRNTALSYKNSLETEKAAAELTSEWGVPVESEKILTVTSKDTRYFQWSGDFAGDYNLDSADANDRVQPVKTVDGKKYLAVLGTQTKGGILGIEKLYSKETGSWVKVQDANKPEELDDVVLTTTGVAGDCSYPWPGGKATVSYYEAGDNKGLPAIIPFDLDEGWYAMVPNSGGTFLDNSPQGYTASADVKYFKICNIGPNRLMQNGQGDDLCQSFDANTLGAVDKFIPCPKKSPQEVRNLYESAREAIRQASTQHGSCTGSSNSGVNILNQQMGCGRPMSQVGGFECQDFMSPDDCKLMFNVCDPVICPPSRCDLGGRMPVSDVIQTGIIGSLVLCLPNAAEGVLFPICLSGIHAGLDAYLSILRSEQECLEKSLETGEHVGICDEITSIYKCEFFWRQLSPVLDQLIPAFVQGAIAPGQRVRGGGEYALVQQSWNSMQKSISYFKDVYAQNAFKAFNIRSTEEVGSEFCKAFVGTSVPGGADMIDSLLEPESPYQFYAQFSEIKFTEATVPATSQYKVYFHIYAGNDQGVQYKIYLKNPPATSYYRSNPTIQVKNGYIAKGSAADEAVDFIAPEGYKELCVVINAKEECGFKQVTTDFGLNYIQDKYVEEQATKTDIKTEQECISGSPSALSMANLNLQAGAEEMASPEIAMRGIVRVCASSNPAAGVDVEGEVECNFGAEKTFCGKGYLCKEDPANVAPGYCEDAQGNRQKAGARWKNVGDCGGGLTCWLDTNSVKNDLGAVSAIEGSSISVLDERKGLIDTGVLKLEDVQKILSSARLKIKGLVEADLKNPAAEGGKVLAIIDELNQVIGTSTVGDNPDQTDIPGAGTNTDRAEALALKATVYRMVVGELTKGLIVNPIPSANDLIIPATPPANGDITPLEPGNGEPVAESNVLLRSVEEKDVLVNDEGKRYNVTRSESAGGDQWVIGLAEQGNQVNKPIIRANSSSFIGDYDPSYSRISRASGDPVVPDSSWESDGASAGGDEEPVPETG